MADLAQLIERVKAYIAQPDIGLIERAYAFAQRAHWGQFRLSKNSYISHPLAVAEILAAIELDERAIAAALLHDTLEDGGIAKEQLNKEFGGEVTALVEGVTKLGQLSFESVEERQAENFRKMFMAMGEDIRVIIIKLADRLHNMRTLKFIPPKRQKEIAKETLEIFAPLAHRLGIWNLKWELEDLAFRYLEPEAFKKMKDAVSEKREEREKYVLDFIQKVMGVLEKFNIKGQIHGRPKHFYSIFRKMVDKKLTFDEVYDMLAVRIIVDTVYDCYAALGAIHAEWKPIPGRFRDLIAIPKPNGYQSLHTTVVGPEGRPVEIQIRTKEMHRIAEHGIAAHWIYKDKETDKKFDQKLSWLRSLIERQAEFKNAKDFMDSLKVDLFTDEVFVFTPKGDVFSLPVGATPIDFAYHVHTEIGHRCMGAKVSGRIVPLDYPLKTGDIVEIILAKEGSPSLDWLNFIKSNAARNKIKQWFRKQKRQESLERGQKVLERELRAAGLDYDKVEQDGTLRAVGGIFNISKEEDLLAAVGYGEISALQVVRKLREKLGKRAEDEQVVVRPESAPQRKRRKKSSSAIIGLEDVLIKYSRCCTPIPGDEVVGLITMGKGVSIHRKECKNITDKDQARLVAAHWNPDTEEIFPVAIEVEAFDRVGLLRDILERITDVNTNVAAANVRTKRGSFAVLKLLCDVRSTEHLKQIIQAIQKVADVYQVYRR